jgi:hypothetical protein
MTLLHWILLAYAALLVLLIAAANEWLGLKHYSWRLPMPNQWLTVGVITYRNDFRAMTSCAESQEYFVCLHLPVYGMRYDITWDDIRWSQDCIYYGTNRGLRRFSIPVPPTAPGLE